MLVKREENIRLTAFIREEKCVKGQISCVDITDFLYRLSDRIEVH